MPWSTAGGSAAHRLWGLYELFRVLHLLPTTILAGVDVAGCRYGKSIPLPEANYSTAALRTLTVDQAIADLAAFVTWVTDNVLKVREISICLIL